VRERERERERERKEGREREREQYIVYEKINAHWKNLRIGKIFL